MCRVVAHPARAGIRQFLPRNQRVSQSYSAKSASSSQGLGAGVPELAPPVVVEVHLSVPVMWPTPTSDATTVHASALYCETSFARMAEVLSPPRTPKLT